MLIEKVSCGIEVGRQISVGVLFFIEKFGFENFEVIAVFVCGFVMKVYWVWWFEGRVRGVCQVEQRGGDFCVAWLQQQV
ncbi:hypothetical protein DX980_31135 [Burkholderia gladioli]|nr:hypothetical protein C3Y08_34040 [Burkholderia gladioli]WAG23617.1 hypothetical protein DX980_31135 [Burkholderia gladioli]